ncbi:hypothetical protein J6590_068416 [Homalodisca vitripennis]|nr:hypothetical protein J6590_068416 [Homalodisca vitripennis]
MFCQSNEEEQIDLEYKRTAQRPGKMKQIGSLGKRTSGVIEPLHVYKMGRWANDPLYKLHFFQERRWANDQWSNRAVPLD